MISQRFFKFISPVLLTCVALFSIQVQAENKSFHPGKQWSDDKGVHINAHGGGMLYYQNKYYWFGEYKSESTSSALVGVTCYSSSDLYNWKNNGIAMDVSDDEKSDIAKGCIIERPKVVYNKKTDKFVMWFHLELKGQGYAAARVGVAVSDKVTGPYKFIRFFRSNPGVYPANMTEEQKNMSLDVKDYEKWWTPEWYKAVSNGLFTKRDLKEGQMSRDMTIFVDDNGKAYHIYSSEENLTLQIAELTDDYLGHSGKYIRIFPGGHNEAPAIFRKDGTYWMITSGCTGWDPNEARMFSAPNIWGPWKQHPNPCVGNDAKLTFHSQSTYVQKVEGKKDAFIFMADRWTPKHPIEATYIWLPIQFEKGVPVLKWHDQWNLDIFKGNK